MRRQPWVQIFVVLSALIGGIFAASAPVSAATAQPFAAQARAAHLTAAQSRALQGQVNGYLARLGGVQVAINEIDLRGTGALFLPLPGHKYARDLSAAQAGPATAATCYFGDFCAWSGKNRTGTLLAKYVCGTFNVPFPATGSWENNQTSGTVATFYDAPNGGGIVVYRTPGAYSASNSYNWSDVSSIRNC